MANKRMSKRARDLIQSLLFFISTFGIISCLIFYLWVYTEIDETLLAIEIQKPKNYYYKSFEPNIKLL